MSYIDKQLLPGEQVLFRTRKHIIIFFLPAVLTLFLVLYGAAYMASNPILARVEWVPWMVALVLWCFIGLTYLSSEFAVTNKRIVMREGFFSRHAMELRIAAISQVNIEQSLLAQLLNYGTVSVNAFGSSDAFTTMASPNAFQRCVNQQLDKLTR